MIWRAPNHIAVQSISVSYVTLLTGSPKGHTLTPPMAARDHLRTGIGALRDVVRAVERDNSWAGRDTG
jgi:hypothetical protein